MTSKNVNIINKYFFLHILVINLHPKLIGFYQEMYKKNSSHVTCHDTFLLKTIHTKNIFVFPGNFKIRVGFNFQIKFLDFTKF